MRFSQDDGAGWHRQTSENVAAANALSKAGALLFRLGQGCTLPEGPEDRAPPFVLADGHPAFDTDPDSADRRIALPGKKLLQQVHRALHTPLAASKACPRMRSGLKAAIFRSTFSPNTHPEANKFQGMEIRFNARGGVCN